MSPESHPSNRAFVLAVLATSTPPKRVLDVCSGQGDYGKMVRIAYPQATVHGIEIWGPYLTQEVRGHYHHTYVGDALEILPTLGHYDLALFVGALEHFERADGRRMLNLCADHAGSTVVITPHKPSAQGAKHGNEHETHRSEWSIQDFKGFDYEDHSDGDRLRVRYWRKR